tara:strand:- start:166 stop:573 length:408 start_codon:yes stop_codon:yes gene_type:complete
MSSRIFYIFIFFLFFFSGKQNIISQYRDPFTVKKRSNKIKKNNKRGLLYSAKSYLSKKQKDSFSNIKKNNGLVGLYDDPFKRLGKVNYKQSGVDKDSFTMEHRKMAARNRYDKVNLRNKAFKSRDKYMKNKIKHY